MSVRRWVVAGTITAALVAGSGAGVWRLQGRLPDGVYDLDEACDGKAYKRAARYEGDGPHPVAVFMTNPFAPTSGQLYLASPLRDAKGAA